jgi:hypothetical protein
MKKLGEPREPIGSRTTLKLKTPSGPRSPAPGAPPKARGAAKTPDWADEHKQRMQADMDALGFGSAPIERRRGRGASLQVQNATSANLNDSE